MCHVHGDDGLHVIVKAHLLWAKKASQFPYMWERNAIRTSDIWSKLHTTRTNTMSPQMVKKLAFSLKRCLIQQTVSLNNLTGMWLVVDLKSRHSPVNQMVHPRNPPRWPRTCPRLSRETWWLWNVTLVARFAPCQIEKKHCLIQHWTSCHGMDETVARCRRVEQQNFSKEIDDTRCGPCADFYSFYPCWSVLGLSIYM
jgi:hypothetical protein